MYASIAVFCGSKFGNDEAIAIETEALGKWMAANEITLVYGGGNKGIMGLIANSVIYNGGDTIGIIPNLLTDREHGHVGLTEQFIVDNMHTRKQMLYEKCEAAIVLPGGIGTLDEFFEIMTWNGLGIHNKPIYLFNINGFYDGILMHMQKMQVEGFLYGTIEDKMIVVNSLEEFITQMDKV